MRHEEIVLVLERPAVERRHGVKDLGDLAHRDGTDPAGGRKRSATLRVDRLDTKQARITRST
jgi:hypothetical protein